MVECVRMKIFNTEDLLQRFLSKWKNTGQVCSCGWKGRRSTVSWSVSLSWSAASILFFRLIFPGLQIQLFSSDVSYTFVQIIHILLKKFKTDFLMRRGWRAVECYTYTWCLMVEENSGEVSYHTWDLSFLGRVVPDYFELSMYVSDLYWKLEWVTNMWSSVLQCNN